MFKSVLLTDFFTIWQKAVRRNHRNLPAMSERVCMGKMISLQDDNVDVGYK